MLPLCFAAPTLQLLNPESIKTNLIDVVDLLEPSRQLGHLQVFLFGFQGLHLLEDDRHKGRVFFQSGLGQRVGVWLA